MEQKRKREKMKLTSEVMRGWAEGLRREVEDWPGVTLKSAFGMTLVYRSGVVFAALPGTRALYEEDAILLKFLSEPPAVLARIASDRRFTAGTMEQRRTDRRVSGGEGRKWRIFRMNEDADVHGALDWIAEAYRLARNRG